MKTLGGIAIGFTCCGASLAAAPCVGTAFDQPFPEATNAVTRVVDAPSSQFPGLWQEGTIAGWPYRLFANGDGDIRSDQRALEWKISFMCPAGNDDCKLIETGAPPADAKRIANNLRNCVLGQPLNPNEIVADPEPETASVIGTEAQDITTQEPCGRALVSEQSETVALQRLIALAGGDPGPADGIIGPQTQEALKDVLGEQVVDLDVPNAIAQLNILLCNGPN